MMCLKAIYKKKNIFFASLKSMKKGVGFGSGSAPKCHGSPTLIITNSFFKILKFKRYQYLPLLQ
jgi:hypothetical protein